MLHIMFVIGSIVLVFCSGYVGAQVARSQTQKLESRIAPPWQAHDRGVLLTSIGFYSGVTGGSVMIIIAALIHVWHRGGIHLNF
jgi:hypothetical protein